MTKDELIEKFAEALKDILEDEYLWLCDECGVCKGKEKNCRVFEYKQLVAIAEDK